MAETDLVASLPAALAARVQSARIVKGRALVVLDAAGLDAAGRTRIEAELTEALSEREDVDEVQVIQTAERTARRLIAVGSGKGGVGKTTTTAAIASALAGEIYDLDVLVVDGHAL